MKMFLSLVVFMTTVTSWAGSCVLTVDRKACPGQEKDTYLPYGGKNPTEEKSELKDAALCEQAAEKAAKIIRKKSLAEKKVKGTFDGKSLSKEYADKSDCK